MSMWVHANSVQPHAEGWDSESRDSKDLLEDREVDGCLD